MTYNISDHHNKNQNRLNADWSRAHNESAAQQTCHALQPVTPVACITIMQHNIITMCRSQIIRVCECVCVLYLLDGRWSVGCQGARERQNRVEIKLARATATGGHDSREKFKTHRSDGFLSCPWWRRKTRPQYGKCEGTNNSQWRGERERESERARRVCIKASSVWSLSYWLMIQLMNVYTQVMEFLFFNV